MPLGNRRRMLAGFGAFVALSTAGIGCQSTPVTRVLHAQANVPASAETEVVVEGPISARNRRMVTLGTPTTNQTEVVSWQTSQREGDAGSSSVASSWRGADRVSDKPNDTLIASSWQALADASSEPSPPALALEPVQPPGTATTWEPPLLDAPRKMPSAPGGDASRPDIAMIGPGVPPVGLALPHAPSVPRELAKVALPPYMI